MSRRLGDVPLREQPAVSRARVMPERRTTCLICGGPFTNIRQIVVHPGACRAAYQVSIRRERREQYIAARNVPRGRQCQECLAYDSETSMSQTSRCDACLQRIQRNGRCELPHHDGTPGHRCGEILRGWKGETYCPAHDPPDYWIEVLWTCEDGRMRRLWRPITNGRVAVGGKHVVVKSNPFTITLRARAWVSVRA